MNIVSVTSPHYIEVDGETPDDPNLEWMDIKKLKAEHRERMKDPEKAVESIGQRLIRGATEAVESCDHNWGWVHWWGNPLMLEPCKITKIDGKWYRRRTCAGIEIGE